MLRRLSAAVLVCLSPVMLAAPTATTAANAGEARAERALEAARRSPLALHAFLARMPKGGELHMHLVGAVYAETFLRNAATDGLCYDPATAALFKPAATTRSLPPQPVCGEGKRRVSDAFKEQKLYDAIVDSFSMRSFVTSAGVSGHDQFFATFARFGAVAHIHRGEWLDEVTARAAAQNEQYLEVMDTPDFTAAAKLGYALSWPVAWTDASGASTADGAGASHEELAKLRDQLLAGGLREVATANRKELADGVAAQQQLERCGTPQATPACAVQVKFLYQILRGFAPQQVFAQTLTGFEAVNAEIESGHPLIVGINFVMPEDGYLSMAEYHRQMMMLDYLHGVYPKVRITLHAGELAPGMVPPDGLRFHIREAIELGHAERIGHGVDVMYEDHPEDLLRLMASRHIMTEINLTSNDVILGVTGAWHPLPQYRAAGVPMALSTDDEGVSRIDLTHEYTRAAMDFSLGYTELKRMARTSLEHSFLPGASLWAEADVYTSTNAACKAEITGGEKPSTRCAELLHTSERAAQQWELERRFRAFENEVR